MHLYDGRNPAPPNMYETLQIMGYCIHHINWCRICPSTVLNNQDSVENTPQKLKTDTKIGHIVQTSYIFPAGPSFWGPPAVQFGPGCPSCRVLRKPIKSNWDPNALHTSTATQAKIPGVPKDFWDTIEGCRRTAWSHHPTKSWRTETENGI